MLSRSSGLAGIADGTPRGLCNTSEASGDPGRYTASRAMAGVRGVKYDETQLLQASYSSVTTTRIH